MKWTNTSRYSFHVETLHFSRTSFVSLFFFSLLKQKDAFSSSFPPPQTHAVIIIIIIISEIILRIRSTDLPADLVIEAGSWKRKVARAAKRNPPSERCFVEIQMTAPPNSWRLFEGRCTGDCSWRRRRKGWSNTNLARTWSFNI